MKPLNWIAALLLTVAAGACTALDQGPDSHTEAIDVEAAAQQTEAMQTAIDRACGHLDVHTQLACAIDVLAELQPDRWEPEDIERGKAAAGLAEGMQHGQ